MVVGISRGGVPVAAEIAHALDAPLELCVVRKVMSPGSPAFEIGAVAEGGATVINDHEVDRLGISAAHVRQAVELERTEVERLGELLRDSPPLALRDRDAILVDDGVTAIDTLRAAVASLRAQQPRSIVIAVPVGDLALIEQLRHEVERVVCLVTEPRLGATGVRYRDFPPVSEAEVVAVLAAARGPG